MVHGKCRFLLLLNGLMGHEVTALGNKSHRTRKLLRAVCQMTDVFWRRQFSYIKVMTRKEPCYKVLVTHSWRNKQHSLTYSL
jgi:hypothetical protein